MAKVPGELKYTKTHEWVRIEGEYVLSGITDFAQSELSDIVYVELPKPGRVVKQDETYGTIEAVKAVADLYSPLSGEIVEVNSELSKSPGIINQDPYEKGWIIKIKPSNLEELNNLLSSEDYSKVIAESVH